MTPARPAALLSCVLAALATGCAGAGEQAPAPAVNTEVRGLRLGEVAGSVPCVVPDLPSGHLHVHLLVLLDGVPVPVPEGIGVGRPWTVEGDGFVSAGSCFAWIHTHDRSGVVHMASPESRPFTLGQVFEVWGHPLGRDGALGYRGAVTVSVDGVPVRGDPGGIELHSFDSIVLALGRPPARPPGRFDFARVRS